MRHVIDTNIAVAAMNGVPAVRSRLERIKAGEIGIPLAPKRPFGPVVTRVDGILTVAMPAPEDMRVSGKPPRSKIAVKECRRV